MSKPTAFLSVLLAALLAPAVVGANTVDKLTYLTFSGPVRIPGAMLDPGTYRFRLTNPDTSRNVVQVLSHDGAAVYAMFHTIPDSRSEITEHSMVTFKETREGVPPIVRSLFYGGEYRGYEFIYPPMEPDVSPRYWPQPEITYLAMPAPVVPEMIESEPSPIRSSELVPYAAAVAPVQTELPRTASQLPWVTVAGLVSLAVGFGVGLVRRHIS